MILGGQAFVPVNPFYSEDGILNYSGVFLSFQLFPVVYSGMNARSISSDIPLAFLFLRFFSVYLLCDFPFVYAVFAYFIRLLMMSGLEALDIKEKDLD